MPKRRLPTCPDTGYLKREAKELLGEYRREKQEAVADFGTFHPIGVKPREASLSDAQLVLARSYQFASWARLKLAAELCRAIYESDSAKVVSLAERHPELLDEPVRGADTGASWGTPVACARFFGRDEVVDQLVRFIGKDADIVLQQAAAVGRQQLSQWFIGRDGNVQAGAVMNPCETLNGDGLAFLIEQGAELADAKGNRLAPIAIILETYSRYPEGKHQCLEVCEHYGIEFPDTPMMAFHRGRIDLLEKHLKQDANLLNRHFFHEDIYPAELGCGERSTGSGLHGTPIHGTTLLHLAVDFDEWHVAQWLLCNGADANAEAFIDEDGFGGHTPLFGTVVSQPNLNGRQADGEMARWLLQSGAKPNVRASLRKGIRFHGDRNVYEYRNVTPLGWGRQFHSSRLVSEAAMKVIAEFGGIE